MKTLIGMVLVALCLVGCDNPRLDPTVAKAMSERRQEETLNKQLVALNRIADALEKLGGSR